MISTLIFITANHQRDNFFNHVNVCDLLFQLHGNMLITHQFPGLFML